LLQQHVLADYADISRSIFHVRRHIAGAYNEKCHIGGGTPKHELSAACGQFLAVIPGLRKELEDGIEQLSL
jgi:hypothetical protein